MSRRPGRMANLGKKSMQRANEALSDKEAEVILSTSSDLQALKSQIGNDEAFDRLIEVVEQATQGNMDIALLKSRIEKMGETVITVAKKAVSLLTK